MFLLEPGGKRFRKTFAPPNRSSTAKIWLFSYATIICQRFSHLFLNF